MLYEITKQAGPITLTYRALPEEDLLPGEMMDPGLAEDVKKDVALGILEHFRVEVEASNPGMGIMATTHLADCYARSFDEYFGEGQMGGYMPDLTEEVLREAILYLWDVQEHARNLQAILATATGKAAESAQAKQLTQEVLS